MRVIAPVVIDDTALVSSNVPETDEPLWDVGTNYTAGDRVLYIGTVHRIYEAVGSTNGDDPSTDDGTNWVEVSADNRWKAFDQKLLDVVSNATTIEYEILAPSLCDNIAFFGLNASAVQVVVTDTSPAVIYDQTIDLTDTTSIVDWFEFYTWGADYDSEAIFTGVPAYSGYTIDITITAIGANAEVGEIVIGKLYNLGVTMPGTTTGIEDFSRKERDTFGNAIIIERAFADRVEFEFHMPKDDARRVKRILSTLRATPAVYYVAEGTSRFGTNIYGFFQDFEIPLVSAGVCYATLEIEGLT